MSHCRGDEERGGGMMGGFGGSMGGVAGNSKAKRPINVKFEIPYFTTSGIQVRYLKIIEPKVRQQSCMGTRHNEWVLTLDCVVVTIPVPAMGAVYYAVRRYSGQAAGRATLICAARLREGVTMFALGWHCGRSYWS